MSLLFWTLGAGTPATVSVAEVTISVRVGICAVQDRARTTCAASDQLVMYLPPRTLGGGPFIEEP